MSFSSPDTIFLADWAFIISPKGIPAKNPTTAPKIAIARYLTIYKFCILLFLIPIAFITPISRYSSLMVNPIVNFSRTSEMMIRQILTIRNTPAVIISMIYVSLMTSRVPVKAIPSIPLTIFSTLLRSSVDILRMVPLYISYFSSVLL